MHDSHARISIRDNTSDDNESSTQKSLRSKIDISAHKELHKRLAIIDEEIIRVFESERGEPEVLYNTARHLLQAGGKHIRSLLTTLSCEAVGGSFNEALPFAVATEFVQTASLIHDDVIDDDDIRRGVESTHRKFGSRMAIIAGDLLVARAVKLVSEYASPELMKVVASTGVKMCEGEASDIFMYIMASRQFNKENYFNIVRGKTVSFMRAAARVGALIGKASDEQMETLDVFSEHMGYAFQIRDDILDITASEKSVGKSVLADLRGNKTNYVLIHALESSSKSDRDKCVELLQQGEIDFALKLIKRTKSIEHASSLTQEYALKAKESIRNKSLLNEDLLCALADQAYDREF